MADVSDIVRSIRASNDEKYKDLVVDKTLQFDEGLLTIYDPENPVIPKPGQAREDYFKARAREATQGLINKLYSDYQTEIVDGVPVIKLPEPKTVLPRSKPIPQPKPPTKWEKFANEKGIKSKSSKNREKLVYDETTRQWVPRYGYKKVKNEEEKDWLIEIPDQADPNVDYFAKRQEEKNERVAKNKFQQLRNVARNRNQPVTSRR